MAYFGPLPQNHYNVPTKDSFNGDGSTVAFTLSRPVANAGDVEVFVDNVQQEPTSAYTVNGTTISFTGTPATGSNNIYAIHRGGGSQSLDVPTGQPGDFTSLNASGDVSLSGNITTDLTMTGTTPTLTIGDAGAEDTAIVFDGNAQDFYIGLDDSADDLVIGLGSAVGTTPAIQIDENQDIKFAQSIGVGQAASSTVGEISAQTMKLLGTTPTLTIGDAGAEDTKIVFDGNAQDYYIALDDSADDLLIGLGSAVGTTPAIAIDENLLATFHGGITMAGTTPTLTIGDAGAEDTKIVFDGNAQDFYIGLDDSADDLLIGLGSAVGTTPAIAIDENLQITTGGDIVMGGATPTLTIGDAGAEDAKIVFDGNAQDFHIGLDDSADDLVIGLGSALGTTPVISIAETLKTSFGGGVVGKTSTANATGSTTLDYDANQNFILTFTGNVTLANPSTESVGQSGIIVIIQDGTGSRSIATGTDYEWPAGTEPAISTAANSVDILPYFVDASNSILLGNPQLAFATPS